MKISRALLLLLAAGTLLASAAAQEAADDEQDQEAKGEDGEECEEAWDLLAFLRTQVRDKVEGILRDSLSAASALPEKTVADAMQASLAIRDQLLARVKSIRTGELTVCPGQAIRQEEFLSELRADIMMELLQLLEPDAWRPENLQAVGRQLLSVRAKANGKITQLIMLRESRVAQPAPADGDDDECDCGVFDAILESLDEIIAGQNEEHEEEDNEAGEEEEEEEDPIAALTMVLMQVDGRLRLLYTEVLGQLDAGKRAKAAGELSSLKAVGRQLNQLLLAASRAPPAKLARLIRRDGVRLRNEVDRLSAACLRACPTACVSCGADKIDDVLNKMAQYNATLEAAAAEEDGEGEGEAAREAIRSDLIQFLAGLGAEMTRLLQAKVEQGGLDQECDRDTLEVINSIKGPLWMLVNVTIFGEADDAADMIGALEIALNDMRGKYCAPDSAGTAQPPVKTEDVQCDLDEINAAGDWIVKIDEIIEKNLFKTAAPADDAEDDEDAEADEDEDDGLAEARINAMLGFVELKSDMEERVRQLFQENLVCGEEVDQIKAVYADQVGRCLSEMMNPRYRFEDKTRAERVRCIKQLRVAIEDRRGELLAREFERRLSENSLLAAAVQAAAAAAAAAGNGEDADPADGGEHN